MKSLDKFNEILGDIWSYSLEKYGTCFFTPSSIRDCCTYLQKECEYKFVKKKYQNSEYIDDFVSYITGFIPKIYSMYFLKEEYTHEKIKEIIPQNYGDFYDNLEDRNFIRNENKIRFYCKNGYRSLHANTCIEISIEEIDSGEAILCPICNNVSLNEMREQEKNKEYANRISDLEQMIKAKESIINDKEKIIKYNELLRDKDKNLIHDKEEHVYKYEQLIKAKEAIIKDKEEIIKECEYKINSIEEKIINQANIMDKIQINLRKEIDNFISDYFKKNMKYVSENITERNDDEKDVLDLQNQTTLSRQTTATLDMYLRIVADKVLNWKDQSLTINNNACVISGSTDNLVIHHLYPHCKIVEETLSNLELAKKYPLSKYTNQELCKIEKEYLLILQEHGFGVPITNEFHKMFHKKYGNKNFSKKDFEEFKRTLWIHNH